MEIAPGLQLLGPILDKFVSVSPLYTPTSGGEADNIFITRSYDATSHFETVVEEVQSVWKRVMGHDLVLKNRENVKVEDKLHLTYYPGSLSDHLCTFWILQ